MNPAYVSCGWHVTHYHKLGGLRQRKVILPQFWRPEDQSQGCTPSGRFHSRPLPTFLGLWLHHSHLCGHSAFPSSVCEQTSLLQKYLWLYLQPTHKIQNNLPFSRSSFSHTYKHPFLSHKAALPHVPGRVWSLGGWGTFFSLPNPAMKVLMSIF